MLLASDVVLVGVLTEVRLIADATFCLETRTFGLCGGGSSSLEDLFREDLGRDGRESRNAALEVVSTVEKKITVRQVPRQTMTPAVVAVKTYCQSFLMWPFCRSLLRKATWQVLQVYG